MRMVVIAVFSLMTRYWHEPLSQLMTASNSSAMLILIASSLMAIKSNICEECFPVCSKCQTDLKVVLLVNYSVLSFLWQAGSGARLAHNENKTQLVF